MTGIEQELMQRVGRIHLVGIGGAGMSGIAEVLHNLGYRVSGSDLAGNAATRRLAEQGVSIFLGHDPAQVEGADVVVISSAVGEDNPEVAAARARRIPVIPRAEMLAELMRFRYGIAVAGTHGKTTTTSLIASVLAEGGLDPTYVIGGRLNSSNSNARLGESRYLVAEADESDASFLHLNPLMVVLTNIDADHLETYDGDLGQLRRAFVEFVQRVPFYGLAVVCADDPNIRAIMPLAGRPLRSYGTEPEADLRAVELRQEGAVTCFTACQEGYPDLPLRLALPGRHNALNALAAVAVGRELGVEDGAIARALEGFEGIARRFQIYGEGRIAGARVTLIDDYGHHPREIAATLEAIRQAWPGRRLVVVFQPHRYSRTRDLFEDFAAVLSGVDSLVLLEVHAAGEPPVAGADSRSLSRAIRLRGQVEPLFLEQPEELEELLCGVLQDQDLLLTLGAGSIGALARRLWEGREEAA